LKHIINRKLASGGLVTRLKDMPNRFDSF